MLIMNVYRQDCSKFENLKKWVAIIMNTRAPDAANKEEISSHCINIEETSSH